MYETSVRKTESVFIKYHLPIFFLLTYLLSWWSAPLLDGGIIPYGPAFAAVIALAVTSGRQGLRDFWRRLTQWRAGWWYIAGPMIIVAFLLAAFVTNLLLGATVASPPQIPSTEVLLQLLLLGGLWEEIGWTGYALPELQLRFANYKNGPLVAALILGMFRGVWHLPLYLNGTLPWYDVVFFAGFALQVFISWIYNKTRGSVPAVMLFHYFSNVLIGSTMLLVFSGNEKTSYYVLFVAWAFLAAIVIAWGSQFRLGWDEAGKGVSVGTL